jgi:biopolymer transport protein TolQ
VWGIHSFRSLANVQRATLAQVAPGIAALIATAIGLLPRFGGGRPQPLLARHRAPRQPLRGFVEEFSNILHRQAVKG